MKLLIAVFAALVSTTPAAAAPDLFFLAVGNTDYRALSPSERASPKRFREFATVNGGARSARRIAELLAARGARAGTLLKSDVDSFVTHDDVFHALDALLGRARKSPHPFVVVYIAGHGLSEGIGWNHFSVPGDFTGPIDFTDLTALAGHAIYAGDLADRLDARKVDYLLLLDSCYEGNRSDADIPSDVLTPAAAESLRASFAPLRFLNEFHQANPVIYATTPGTIVETVTDPLDPASYRIGPIARRMLLATADGKAKSLNGLFRALLDAKLDGATAPAVSRSDPGLAERPLLPPVGKPTTFDTVVGTGRPRSNKAR